MTLTIIGGALAIRFGALSYYVVERPFPRLRYLRGPKATSDPGTPTAAAVSESS